MIVPLSEWYNNIDYSNFDFSENDPRTEIDFRILSETLLEVMETLTDRERQILYRRIWEGETFTKISKFFNITPTRVSQVYSRAIRKLKHRTRLDPIKKVYYNWTKEEYEAIVQERIETQKAFQRQREKEYEERRERERKEYNELMKKRQEKQAALFAEQERVRERLNQIRRRQEEYEAKGGLDACIARPELGDKPPSYVTLEKNDSGYYLGVPANMWFSVSKEQYRSWLEYLLERGPGLPI